MKTFLKIGLIVLFAFCTFLFAVEAQASEAENSDSGRVYDIRESDSGGYEVLFCDGESEEKSFFADKLSEILEYINLSDSEAEVKFSELICAETLTFHEGKYLLSGSLKFKGDAGIVIENADVTLKNITVDMEDGEIRLKNGYLRIENGFIKAEKTAIKMDYSSSAVFEMKSGEISASSEEAALRVDYGSATVGGGSIKNSVGPAIFSSSTLILHGAPDLSGIDFDIFLKSPVTLGQGDKKFTGECDIKYDREFEKGRINVVAYGASEQNEQKIKLFDSFGREQCVKFYKEHPETSERNFLTAYLPYEIKFMGETSEIQYKLKGEKIEPPDPLSREGYDFIAWKSGGVNGENFEINSTVTKDEVFYPSYRLRAPEFSFLSMEFIYSETGKYLSLDKLSHPLLNDGIMSYKWFKDGEEIKVYGDKILIKNVSDSGKYKCLFTFSYKSDAVSVETPEVSVTVLKKLIEVPEITGVEYDGQWHSPSVHPLSTYEVRGDGGVDAGAYPITFSVTDPQNYGFYPGGEESVTVDFLILKSKNEWTEELAVHNSYTWESLKVIARAKLGDVCFLFSDKSHGEFTDNPPVLAGVYYVKAVVYENENYFGIESEALEFRIIEDKISSLYIVSDAIKKSYKAFELFSLDGLSVCAGYISGREEILSVSDISVSYHSGQTLLFGDSSVVISYGGKSVLYPIEVTKAEYDVSGIIFENSVYEYCGRFISPSFELTLPIGLDGIPLSYEIVGGGTNVGDYAVELRFYTESENYRVPDSIRKIMTVSPKSVEIIWESLCFVYDGNLKIPSAYFTDINGYKVALSVSGERSFAGVYEAIAVFAGKNYTAQNTVAKFEILKADYDLSGVFWSADELVYCGEEQCVTLSGLPLGVAVVGYSDNRATDAGIYTAGVTLSYDTENYNSPKIMPFEWRILKAEYDLSDMQFSDGEFIYDGGIHFPRFFGSLPVGLDGSIPSYTFSQGVVNVSEGKTLVKISFSTSSKNYNPPADIYRFVTVLPLEIEVEWESCSFVYSGTAFAPRATAPESEILVTGAQINAGKYTAFAKALDSNYLVRNCECEFEILKAENRWSVLPSISDIYASQSLAGKGKAEFGNTEYIYSSDKTDIISEPSTHGVFYFKAVSEGDENHLSISSEWLRFEIIEVVAVDFFVEMIKSGFLTLEKITETDFKAFVKNNDLSIVEIPYSEISVIYPQGEYLRLADDSVCFSYLDFSVTEQISVSRRDYDLSGVFWEGLRVVYDGNEKHACLCGLPEGVEVIDYIGNGSVNAGMYVIRARLRYDTENYNEPIVPDVIMTVEKQTVLVPDIESAEYTSQIIFPIIESSALYYYDFSGATEAGEYKIAFTLYDPENYTFEGNQSQIEKSFFIDKIKLIVQVSDIEKYLFGKYGEPEYTILSGKVAEGEVLYPIYDIGEDAVFVKFEDTNYEIEIIPGKINVYNRLSPRDTKLFVFLLIIFLFGAVSIILIIVNRKKILKFYRTAPVRNDSFIPTPPIAIEPDFRENTEFDSCEAAPIPLTEPQETEESYTEEERSEETDATACAPTVIDAGYADSVITDSLARDLIRRENEIKTNGTAKRIINVDTLSRSFCAEDRVDINILKSKSLIPYDTGYIKVLARGIIDKPLIVYANDFSLSAVKMIALAGGKSIKVNTVTEDSVKFRKKT